MTRKKLTNPCYGLAWETTIYLYPFEESFEVDTGRPPTPREQVEARMYGARLVNRGPGEWVLQWTKEALRDFYLNNILIHELAHILDDRNTTYADRERFAEAFATRYGYQATGGWAARHESKTKKRHHKK